MGVTYVQPQQRPGARTVRVAHFGSHPVGMDNQVPPPPPARSRVCHVGREGLSVEHLAPLLSCLCTPLGRCCGDGWGRQTSLALRILLLVSFPLTRLPIRQQKDMGTAAASCTTKYMSRCLLHVRSCRLPWLAVQESAHGASSSITADETNGEPRQLAAMYNICKRSPARPSPQTSW